MPSFAQSVRIPASENRFSGVATARTRPMPTGFFEAPQNSPSLAQLPPVLVELKRLCLRSSSPRRDVVKWPQDEFGKQLRTWFNRPNCGHVRLAARE